MLQLRKISQDLSFGHATGQVPEYVTDGDAGSAHDWLAEANTRCVPFDPYLRVSGS